MVLANQQRHLATKCAEHTGQLNGNVPTTNHHRASGTVFEFEESIRSDTEFRARQIRHCWMPTAGDHDSGAGQSAVTYRDFVGTDDTSITMHHLDTSLP